MTGFSIESESCKSTHLSSGLVLQPGASTSTNCGIYRIIAIWDFRYVGHMQVGWDSRYGSHVGVM
jgi:hypothetical protein